MDEMLKRALAAAARAFADVMDPAIQDRADQATSQPAAGSKASMIAVLGSVAAINRDEHRGANDNEMRSIAARAGMDPRGMAGYYTAAAQLLEFREGEGRWVTAIGEERLVSLQDQDGSAA